MGAGAAFFMFIGETMLKATGVLNQTIWTIAWVPVLTATTFFGSYKTLSIVSAVGLIVLSIVFISVMCVCLVVGVEREAKSTQETDTVHVFGASLSGYLHFLGTFLVMVSPITLQPSSCPFASME